MEQDQSQSRKIASPRRRTILKAGVAAAGASVLGFPAIVRAQSDKIIIGHLTPRTGFLGPMGEYAVMSINLAVEEQNKAGGLLGRQITLLSEDSVNPPTASSKAQRLLERGAVFHTGPAEPLLTDLNYRKKILWL